MARKEKPFDKIVMTRTNLDMAVKHPDAFNDSELRDLIADAQYTVTQLMGFRNIINAMVLFDVEPEEAARFFTEM